MAVRGQNTKVKFPVDKLRQLSIIVSERKVLKMMTVYELKFCYENGASCTCEAFATDTHTAEESMMDCIKHMQEDGAKLLTVTREERVTPVDPDDIDPATIDPSTFECRFVGRSGATITIDRYGQDDYSAAWDDSCSVRGTFTQIMEELKGEI